MHISAEIELRKVASYTYTSQYKLRPVSIEGALFEIDGFDWYTELAQS